MTHEAPRLIDRDDAEYPPLLREQPDSPERLWVRGTRLDHLPPFIAVVGTRTPTPYGRQITHDLASDLVVAGFCVVSGLARGLDGCAHEGALDAGGTTVAVLGTGIDNVHPRVHASLAERIQASGALISEFPPGMTGFKSNFLARNRIIAWMSLGVVVVQARTKSGALNTARLARDANRSVFAVPGAVDVEASAGPHDLIRGGARICAGVGDVVAELESAVGRTQGPAPKADRVERLPPMERSLLGALRHVPRSVESIVLATGLPVKDVLSGLTRMEHAGLAAEPRRGGWVRL